MILKVDKWSRARAFYGGLGAIPSIGGSLVFFKRSLDGSRKLILRGPWPRSNFQGKLSKISENKYMLTASDTSLEAEYQITYEKVTASELELSFSIRAPNQGGNLELEILKLSGDMFKGSRLEAIPHSKFELQQLPNDPNIYGKRNRTFLRKKNKLILRTHFFNLEIADLSGNMSLNIADFRTAQWDKFKSFNIYTIKHGLTPGVVYSFKYRFRFLPASVSEVTEKKEKTFDTAKSEIIGAPLNPWRFFALSPKRENLKRGFYELKPNNVIYGSSDNIAVRILATELHKLTGLRLKVRPAPSRRPVEGILVETEMPGLKEVVPLPPEGFEIKITKKRITILGRELRGSLYGVYALLSRLVKSEMKWILQIGTLRDWPDTGLRGICTVPVRSAIQDVKLYKRYINAFSRARSNLVIFYHRPEQILAWKKGSDEKGWKQEQMAEIARYARSLQMDVWAGLGTNFKAQRFPGLEIAKGTKFYNPFAESSYRFLFSLYEVLLRSYQPSTLLIGHDEIYGLSVYASERKSTAEILAKDVEKIYKWLKERGVATAMWGDMLLDHSRWGRLVGAAHSGQNFRNSGETAAAISGIPKGVKILDWHYSEKPDYPSIDYFRKKGFQVLGGTWNNPRAAKVMAASIKSYGGQGIIGTDWGFWRTHSPATTTLYSVLCGWSSECVIGQNDEGVRALAESLKPTLAITLMKQEPINMSSAFNASTLDITPNDNKGVFDLGYLLDLRYLPVGLQKIGGVLFTLNSPGSGNNNNCVVVGFDRSGNLSPLEEKKINIEPVRAEALAFLYTSYMLEPKHVPRKIGTYTIEYADSDSTSISLIEGWNITDVRSSIGLRKHSPGFYSSPDILAGAELAWRGRSASGLPLNVQMLVWENPFPHKKIKRIKVAARRIKEKKNFRIVLLALTVLRKTS